ncbi:MAG TPA: hypothetical protein VK897_19425 [Anaerolineales bacterium]|nr:hypothetical protein [Anaerolineales bacterium]
MARQRKIPVPGKVRRESNRRFKIDKGNGPNEVDIEVEILEDGDYLVEKLSLDEDLPTHMHDGNPIRWLNNFSIQKNGQYINQPYRVTIPGLSNRGKSRLVIYDGNGDPYYYTGPIIDNTFELTDGDPAGGLAP